MNFQIPLLKENLKKAAMPATIVFCALLAALALWRGSVPAFADDGARGGIQVQVLDGRTEQPLTGAKVVIPEMGKSYETDVTGKTKEISMPVSSVSLGGVAKPWGECTILVYAEGYIPYALFGAHVYEGQLRSGPLVYMFPLSSGQGAQPFSLTEGPPREFVNKLIDFYKDK